MYIPMKIHAYIVIVVLSIIATCSYIYNLSSDFRELRPYSVNLIQSYTTTVNVGKSDNKEVFRGRFFHSASNLIFDREIDGFYYQQFVDGGKQPLAGTINLSRINLGEKEPVYSQYCLLMAVTFSVMFLLYLLIFLLGGFNNYERYQY